MTVDKANIERAYGVIAPYIRQTPIVEVAADDLGLSGEPIIIKLELMQRAGSFKMRGAFLHLLDARRAGRSASWRPRAAITARPFRMRG